MFHDLLSPKDVIAPRERARTIAETIVAPAARNIANGNERIDGFPYDVFTGLAQLDTYSHLWPTAEDRTRAAAGELMREALHPRSAPAPVQAGPQQPLF